MSAEHCLERAREYAAKLQVRNIQDGLFYRNLPKNQVAVRYECKRAELGYRIKCGKWTNSSDGLSVNVAECCTRKCSIALGASGDKHVAEIRLKTLSQVTGIDLYATHDPTPIPRENPCHFLILPKAVTPEDLIAALMRLDEEIPSTKPQTPEEIAKFNSTVARIDGAIQLHRNIG